MFSVVVMSCDRYKCLTPAFDHCIDKYYPKHPTIHYIYGDGCWTKRVREGLKKIEDEFVLFILDDMLIREPVNQELIDNALDVLKNNKNIAAINFEKNYREADEFSKYWLQQRQNQFYLHSCQPSLWRREALIDNLQKNEDAWTWELTTINNNWIYLINKDANIINIGKTNDLNWGISRGKISEEFKNFLIAENIYTDQIDTVFTPNQISIITPYYQTLQRTKRLAQILEPQLDDRIEWIIIDDGCHEKALDKLKARVIHLDKNSNGASIPRNVGLDLARGKYILFIDSDDTVSNNYISRIRKEIEENGHNFDYCYIGWHSPYNTIIIEDKPPEWNLCIWNCIYKKEQIGESRFNPNIRLGEDGDFNSRVRKGRKSSIKEVLYYYDADTPNSLMKRG